MSFTFVDLFAGIGGFHLALSDLGGHCVGAIEIDARARAVYERNFADSIGGPFLRDVVEATELRNCRDISSHDVLTAGFPCQPFSKSGAQRGLNEARGTLFYNIAQVIEERRPRVVVLENVPNLVGPRHRSTWLRMAAILRGLGYWTPSEPFKFSPHLLAPTLGGSPQVRTRVFIVAVREERNKRTTDAERLQAEAAVPFSPSRRWSPDPSTNEEGVWDPDGWDLESSVMQSDDEAGDLSYCAMTDEELEVLEGWSDFVSSVGRSDGVLLPGFPLWLDAMVGDLQEKPDDPQWRKVFIRQNQAFFEARGSQVAEWMLRNPGWRSWSNSRRKLEWQAQSMAGIWEGLIQFRPSGVRVKRATYAPALVAMTQTSIFGPRRRRLTVREAARLQAFPDWFEFKNVDGLSQPPSVSYRQLGNAVAVGAVSHVLFEVSQLWPFFPADLRQEMEAARRRRGLPEHSLRPGGIQGVLDEYSVI